METLTPADFLEDLNPLNNAGRRVFIKGLGFVSVALLLGTLGGCDKLEDAIKNRPIRRRLRIGSPDVDADIDTYRQAVAAMKAVPSREWLEFEGGVISALFQQSESALARRWRSRHGNGYHKVAGGGSRSNAFRWGRLVRSLGSRGADPHSRLHRGTPGSGTRRRAWARPV